MVRIPGFFSPVAQAKRPYVSCLVFLPRFQVAGFVRFLVDTGADTTAIHWGDRLSLAASDGAPLPADAQFSGKADAAGISGDSVGYGIEPALFLFTDDAGQFFPINGDVSIGLTPQTDGIPSLLGRDLMDHMALNIDVRNSTLAFETH